jgi:hypothetical protein
MVEAGYSSESEKANRARLARMVRGAPIPDDELWSNLGLFINRIALSRILFMEELYRAMLPVNGVIMEFGVRWGQNMALFNALRGIHEPFNRSRTIVGFDTFEGFPEIDEEDSDAPGVFQGAYGVTAGYEDFLADVLDYQESESPIAHLRKYEIVKGDATKTLEEYLAKHPETIIALAYFDFDIHAPTKRCLELIKPHLTRGSVVGFDELNCPDYPGESVALKETFDLNRVSLRRSPHSGYSSYFVLD